MMTLLEKLTRLIVVISLMCDKPCGTTFSSNLFIKIHAGTTRAAAKGLISEVLSDSRLLCGASCLRIRECVAIYFKENSNNEGANCLLSNSLDGVNPNSENQDGDWSFYTKISLGDSTCQNGGTAIAGPGDASICKCPRDFEGKFCHEKKDVLAKSCSQLHRSGISADGVYSIDPDGKGAMQVYCDMNGGGWTMIQRRQDGRVDFYRNWLEYSNGFGDLNGEFWLGLDNIHRLTHSGLTSLRVDMMDFDDDAAYALYDNFSVAAEEDDYVLRVGNYSGNPGDSLSYHNMLPFSTRDRDNDQSTRNCAQTYRSGWWYKDCHYAHLNARYMNSRSETLSGICWYYWKNNWQVLKKVSIKIRSESH